MVVTSYTGGLNASITAAARFVPIFLQNVSFTYGVICANCIMPGFDVIFLAFLRPIYGGLEMCYGEN